MERVSRLEQTDNQIKHQTTIRISSARRRAQANKDIQLVDQVKNGIKQRLVVLKEEFADYPEVISLLANPKAQVPLSQVEKIKAEIADLRKRAEAAELRNTSYSKAVKKSLEKLTNWKLKEVERLETLEREEKKASAKAAKRSNQKTDQKSSSSSSSSSSSDSEEENSGEKNPTFNKNENNSWKRTFKILFDHFKSESSGLDLKSF